MEGHGVLPFGLAALYMLRIEAGLLLLEADFDSSRYAWNDAHRSTPDRARLGLDVQGPQDRRPGVHRPHARSSARSPTRRRAGRCAASSSTGEDYDRVYNEAGLIPPKDHAPVVEDWMRLRRRLPARSATPRASCTRRCSSATSRSPASGPSIAKLGTKVNLEFTVDHHYEQVAAHVARLPLYNPERKTA